MFYFRFNDGRQNGTRCRETTVGSSDFRLRFLSATYQDDDAEIRIVPEDVEQDGELSQDTKEVRALKLRQQQRRAKNERTKCFLCVTV